MEKDERKVRIDGKGGVGGWLMNVVVSVDGCEGEKFPGRNGPYL